MKTALFAILMALTSISCVSSRYIQDDLPDTIHFERIDTVTGTKDQLFAKANEWVALNFKSANDVIQMKDKEAGKLIAKGALIIRAKDIYGNVAIITFTLNIEVKEGRYRYEFSNFNYAEAGTIHALGTDLTYANRPKNELYGNSWDNLRGDCYVQAKALKQSLREHMKSKGSNW